MRRSVNGTEFAYEIHGDAEATPVVFLHGMPTDRRSMVPRFEPVFESLRGARSFRRIYPDLPGAGETPRPDSITDVDAYVQAVIDFIEAETAGSKRLAIVASSWGACVAIAYAARHAERLAGLALVAPWLGPDSVLPPRQTVGESEPGAFEGLPEPLVAGLSSVLAAHSRRVVDAIVKDVVPGMSSVDMATQKPIIAWRESLTKAIVGLEYHGPTLVVTGRQDAVCGYLDAWQLASRLPRASYVVLDRCGHAVQTEQIDLVRAVTSEWLARVNEALGRSYWADGASTMPAARSSTPSPG
jgi:pimeloyl-ACP methyl ester carboxylesterase